MPNFVKITDGASIEKYDELNPKYSEGIELQKKKFEEEGYTIIQRCKINIRYYVKDYEDSLYAL